MSRSPILCGHGLRLLPIGDVFNWEEIAVLLQANTVCATSLGIVCSETSNLPTPTVTCKRPLVFASIPQFTTLVTYRKRPRFDDTRVCCAACYLLATTRPSLKVRGCACEVLTKTVGFHLVPCSWRNAASYLAAVEVELWVLGRHRQV